MMFHLLMSLYSKFCLIYKYYLQDQMFLLQLNLLHPDLRLKNLRLALYLLYINR